MQTREEKFSFTPTHEERVRGHKVVNWWASRPNAWKFQLALYEQEWSPDAISRRLAADHAKAVGDLGPPPQEFHVREPENLPFRRLAVLVEHLLDSRSPLELPRQESVAQARWILFAARSMQDPDLLIDGRPNRATTDGLNREWVLWGVHGSSKSRESWAGRVNEALLVLADGPDDPESSLVAIRMAEDGSWLIAGDGTKYLFRTPRQREVATYLYDRWREGGDGAFTSEAAIMEGLELSIQRLRLERTFSDRPALGRILIRGEGKQATWALFLNRPKDPEQPTKSPQEAQ